MDETQAPGRRERPRWLAPAGFIAAGLLAGGILAGTLSAGAQSSSPTPSATAGTKEHRGGGAGETLLTGTTAERVRAAALEAVPGRHDHPRGDRLGRVAVRGARP